jgi:soluble lytic murein transglycosylase
MKIKEYLTHRRFMFTLPWLLLVLGWTAPAWGGDVARRVDAAALGDGAGRSDYLRAERVLKQGDQAAFATLRDRLRDYPLYPYLRFAELGELKTAPEPALAAFLEEFPDTPQVERVRAAYIKRLAQAERWAELARIYREDDGSAEQRCYYLRARLDMGANDALDAVRQKSLWLVPRAQPAACDPLFAAWRARGALDADLIWQRIRLALEADEVGLARSLQDWLPEDERSWFDRWLAIRDRPARVLEPLAETGAPFPLAAAMLADGMARLAPNQPEQAASALSIHGAILARDPAAWDRAHATVGQALTPLDGPRGLAVWDRLGERADNLEAQERRLRAAIGQRDWSRVADWVRRMPEREEKRDRWLYWQGRAEAALGQDEAARATFAAAAHQRSLWGLLAADRLGLPYNLDSRPVAVEPERLQRLTARPALERIRELRDLGRDADMRREWRTLTRDLDLPDLQAAATLAAGLDWHDQAILTLARTDYWDDLELRFPLAYRDLVEDQAWQTGLPADWIYAVIRQESVFNPGIASEAGALGLMQLMPGTAKDLATEVGDPAPRRGAILQPAANIDLGSRYLARMRDRFGHAALATAAYNAGPRRVARWLPDRCTEADIWIATIPYAETRGYVERVLAYRIIYQRRLGLEPLRLSELLPPVPAG